MQPMLATAQSFTMIDDPARRAIKVWMREVMTAKGWTASQWARRAGTTPTNITRFLSPTSSIMPSSATIAKLSRVAGSQPKLNPLQNLNVDFTWQVPCISAALLSSFKPEQLWGYIMTPAAMGQTIAVDGPIDGPAFVADVPSLGMTGRGIQPGDRILIEQCKARDLVPGNVVLFRHEDTARIGEWQGQTIVFYPQMMAPEFRPLRSSEVEIYGRVRRLIREL